MQDRRGLLRLVGIWAAAGALAWWEADEAEAQPLDLAEDAPLPHLPQMPAMPAMPAIASTEQVVCPMVFPVEGGARYGDGFGACREGCRRRHLGQDLHRPKHTWLVAAFTGRITRLVVGPNGGAGNTLWLSGDGWTVKYFHINNDRPGTDDGQGGRRHAFAHGLHVGQRVEAWQRVARLGDSGNAEGTPPHLHFELWRNGRVYDPRPSLEIARRNLRHVQV